MDAMSSTCRFKGNKVLGIIHVILPLEAEDFFLSSRENPSGVPSSPSKPPHRIIYPINFLSTSHVPDLCQALGIMAALHKGTCLTDKWESRSSPRTNHQTGLPKPCLLRRVPFFNSFISTIWARRSPAQ